MRTALALLLFAAAAAANAMGFTEDPQERLTKSWTLDAVKTLEIRGQIDFELVPGPVPKVTVETTRALFDQLTVVNWWGAATVAIESGLRGPRELGAVKARIELPSLASLTVSDKSAVRGIWPGKAGELRIFDHSTADMVIEGGEFRLETSWLTKLTLAGRVTQLHSILRHQSAVDATSLQVGSADVFLDENSTYDAGSTVAGTGIVRHGSTVWVQDEADWKELILKEDSSRTLRKDELP